MDLKTLRHLQVEDITASTIPPDFERNPKIHNCWLIRK
jgi:23S rRNA (guanine2445-N2)-methyltransferase / 23S rRNA (guanine2069-N7)-methyltransferase